MTTTPKIGDWVVGPDGEVGQVAYVDPIREDKVCVQYLYYEFWKPEKLRPAEPDEIPE